MLKKKLLFALSGIAAVLAVGLLLASQDHPTPAEHQQPSNDQEEVSPDDIKKASEAFGHFIGRNLHSPGINFDIESIIKGMRDGAAGKPSPMDEKEYETLMGKLQAVSFKKISQENLKKANEYFKEIANQNGVQELEPGKIYYEVLKEGSGPEVDEHGNPLVSYKGTYLDGTQFGSSDDVGGPITIPLDQTIPGFRKGLIGMKEGEKRRLYVHPESGYGTSSSHMPPNSTLIFEIEIVKASSPETSEADDEENLLPLPIDDELLDSDGDSDNTSDEAKEEDFS